MNDESVLIPGMIIPEMEICFAGVLRLKCTSQVIYKLSEDGKSNRCGLAILDMDINSYSRLTQVLYNTIEPNAYISNEVDMDSLWEFFFDTGFIYPKKYRLIHSRKENFKETYRKLYQESPEIAKHFTYQENGKVYGHISMIRAYERTWMMQHYAARNMKNRRTGFIVLKHIINYLNRLRSENLIYNTSILKLPKAMKPSLTEKTTILQKKLNLTESSIRDYVRRLIKKGIPIDKNKINNKNIQLSISPNLKKIASLNTILQLRDI